MAVLLAVVLFLNAVFNVVAWPRFYPRIAKDPRARDAEGRATVFLKVHVTLIAIALVLALLSAIGGVLRSSRSSIRRGRERGPRERGPGAATRRARVPSGARGPCRPAPRR